MAQPALEVSEVTLAGPPPRETWNNRAEFILSCIGLSVGFGNIWRFPYLAYKNGGAAFLFPYVLIMLVIGRPIYYLELALGQFTSQSAIAVWRCCPAAKGIGWAQQVICIIVSLYYNVLICYIIFYLCASFAKEVPWAKCHAWWGADELCYVRKGSLPSCKDLEKQKGTEAVKVNITCVNINHTRETASEQYWRKYVLHIDESSGINDLGIIRWDLALCLLLAWIIVFVCLIRGIRSSGKVVWFTALFPYVVLLILIIRGLTLDGATTGLEYLFVPKWSKLMELQLWKEAAEQCFFSLSISWGVLVMFASYNNFNQKVYIDSYIVASVDFVTTILGCLAVFSVLGYLSQELNIDIEHVAKAGPGLAFVAYPEAVALLPFSPLWSILFFSMMICLGLDTQFAMLEAIVTNTLDQWPWMTKWRMLILAGCCLSLYLIGLSCITVGGQYLFHLMDNYGAGSSVIFVSFSELIGLMWIYGYKNLKADFEFMMRIKLWLIWRIVWCYVCPTFLLIMYCIALVFTSEPKYETYEYPVTGQILAYFFQFASVLQIPIWMIVAVVNYHKKRQVRAAFRPKENWGPADPEIKRKWRQATGPR